MKVLAVLDDAKYLTDIHGFLSKIGWEDVELTLVTDDENVKEGFDKAIYVKELSGDILVKLDTVSSNDYDMYIGPHTKKSLEVLSYLAGKKNIPILSEVVEYMADDGKLVRNILSGRGLVSYKMSTPIAVTVSPGRFKGSLVKKGESVSVDVSPSSKIIGKEEKSFGGVDIENADIVVGVGRGFKEKSDLDMAFELAKVLGGEVGCSRPIAADYNWLDEDRWIGISGKKIRGKLYIAIGISGAPQHIMAANDVKTIVAINKDKNAPIFEYAEYGVVADLYSFLPVFIKKLRERLGK